jgi:hypothetical protein
MKKTTTARACFATALILLCLAPAAQADKTDVVRLINGDDVTGEVKSLEFGELRYSTDSMGTVSIEWEEVVALRSDQALQVEVTSGARFFGNLVPASAEGMVAIELGGNVQELDILRVVRITPIETDEKIWQRMEGSVKFGFDSDKASAVTSGYLNANVRYRARTFLLGLDISTSFTDQPGAETTQNQSFGMNYQRFRDNRWYTDWFASTERNDAQGIDQRLSGGGGLGRYLVQSNTNQFSLLGGLVATRESFIGPDPDTTNAEGKVQVRYQHRRNEPTSDITFTSEYYPLLEDLSNFRSNSNLSLRREIIDDLFFDLSFFYNYLSDPPEAAENDDYGVITSIGYSF